MNTSTLTEDAINEMSESEQLVLMALTVLQNRVKNLPDEDRRELFELVRELPTAPTAEESHSLWLAIREILAQTPMTARALPLRDAMLSSKAKKWAQHVGEQVRALRKERGWTQTQLAKKAGLPQSHVCRIERAEYTATHKTLDKLATALGVDIGTIDPGNAALG